MSTGGKGDQSRPGTGYQNGWERIFTPELCLRCGRTGHTPEDCKMPVVEEERKQDELYTR